MKKVRFLQAHKLRERRYVPGDADFLDDSRAEQLAALDVVVVEIENAGVIVRAEAAVEAAVESAGNAVTRAMNRMTKRGRKK